MSLTCCEPIVRSHPIGRRMLTHSRKCPLHPNAVVLPSHYEVSAEARKAAALAEQHQREADEEPNGSAQIDDDGGRARADL